MVLPVAAFFTGALIFAAEIDVFFTAGVLLFLVCAAAAGAFVAATFFVVAFTGDFAVLAVLDAALLVLALDLPPATFLAADFVFWFAMMSPLHMSKSEIWEPGC